MTQIPTTTARFLFHFAKKQWLGFGIIIFACTMWGINDAVFPYLLKRIINTVQTYHGANAAIYTAVGGSLILFAVVWITAEFCMRLQGVVQIYTFPRFRADIRSAVFGYTLLHSHEYFANYFAGNIAKKIGDLPTSAQVVMEVICYQFVTASTIALIVLGMAFMTNPFYALVILVWLCTHLGLTFLCLRSTNRLSAAHADTVSTLNGNIVDTFSNMMNVRLFARKIHEIEHLSPFQAAEIKAAKKALWSVEWMRFGLGLNAVCLVMTMLLLLVYGFSKHWITIGDLTQLIMQSFWLLGWIWYVSYQLSMFAREVGTINNALNLVKARHALVDQPEASALKVHQGTIQFAQVSFAYQPTRPVFTALNLTIPAGQKVGLVGFSGSGKSTFVNLLLRFYDIQSGRILIDDQNIAAITQDSLHANIAMIPQDPSLFHRTLMENIRYGRLEASDEEVIAAAKLAHCHEFIEKLEGQYEALVGERGVKLSGGQRQRIAIARAILKNAPILILDEATSSLDSVTEKLIQESLATLMQTRTTIVIAHRLSTLADMDRILVFHHGVIIEEGSQAELLAKKGHFAMLWAMQMDGFLPEETETP